MQLIEFILGIAALILVHEFGHFLAFRMLKVKVDEFGIGFPPRMVKLFEYKGTLISLNWIPLGGFVRPAGDNDPAIEGGLAAASPWVRLAGYVAGPLMNLLVAVLMGVLLFYTLGDAVADKVLVEYVASGSPAEQAGFQVGDQFVSVNGQAIDSTEKLQALISQNLGVHVEIVMLRQDQTYTVTLTPRANPPEGEGAMGVVLGNPTQPIGLGKAVYRGVEATYENIKGIFLLPVRWLRGQIEPEESRLVGYKGMYDIYQQLASPLSFFMVISISLGVMNLLPIPALDGGRILLTLPEIVLRRRIPPKYENAIHAVGFALVLVLLLYVNIQDFINPIQLPR